MFSFFPDEKFLPDLGWICEYFVCLQGRTTLLTSDISSCVHLTVFFPLFFISDAFPGLSRGPERPVQVHSWCGCERGHSLQWLWWKDVSEKRREICVEQSRHEAGVVKTSATPFVKMSRNQKYGKTWSVYVAITVDALLVLFSCCW